MDKAIHAQWRDSDSFISIHCTVLYDFSISLLLVNNLMLAVTIPNIDTSMVIFGSNITVF